MSACSVVICADPKDGNDAAEEIMGLPLVPRVGDTISVTVPTGTTPLEVEAVDIEAPNVRVWVRLDGYRLEDLDEAMASLHTGYAHGTSDDVAEVAAALRWTGDDA